MNKRVLAILIAALMLLAAVPASATTYLTIATGGTQGTYYALGGDLANLLTKELEGFEVTATSTGGSAENIRNIDQANDELATVQNDVATYAYQGVALFEGEQIQSFSVIGNLYPEVVQLVYAADSGITDLDSLRGKRVSIGAAGSGVYQNAMDFLAVAGLTIDDIDPQLLSFGESADAIKNRQVDAAFVVAGVPNPAVTDLASGIHIELMNLPGEVSDQLCAEHPYYNKYTVAAGTYQNQELDADTVNVSAILIVSNELDEDTVYNITKILYEQTDDLSHAKKAEIKLENALNGYDVSMLHPGAVKFYAEKGMM